VNKYRLENEERKYEVLKIDNKKVIESQKNRLNEIKKKRNEKKT
jgi:methylmalonyl-CoA mutase N-terminal domain/subunit